MILKTTDALQRKKGAELTFNQIAVNEFERMRKIWQLCDDCFFGESAVKENASVPYAQIFIFLKQSVRGEIQASTKNGKRSYNPFRCASRFTPKTRKELSLISFEV